MIPMQKWMENESWYRYNEHTDEMELTELAPESVKPSFDQYLNNLRKERKDNPNLIIEPI